MSADRPVVLHLGYPKTATTWLQRHVFQPGNGFVHLFARDEIADLFVKTDDQQFDEKVVRRRIENRLAEVEPGQQPVVSLERLVGAPYAGGYDRLAIARRLAAVFPDAGVLVCIREQVAAIASLYKQYVRSGGYEPLPAYLQPVEVYRLIPRFDFAYFDYGQAVDAYRSVFGGRVNFVPYELLRADQAAFLGRLGDVLGREVGAPESDRVVRPGLSAAAIGVLRPVHRVLRRTELNQAPMVDAPRLATTLNRAAAWVDLRLPPRARRRFDDRMEQAVATACGDRFRAGNRHASAALDLDLGALGYAV
jgi:hypothetical protein